MRNTVISHSPKDIIGTASYGGIYMDYTESYNYYKIILPVVFSRVFFKIIVKTGTCVSAF